MTLFFTSDMHFGHQNIIGFCGRPFKDVDHMNSILVNNYNTVVHPNDVVVFVGDVCMGRRDETLPILKRLNGFKILVPGNHDNCHNMYGDINLEKWERSVKQYAQYFDDIIFDDVYLWEDFVVCHFPYGDQSPDYQGRDFSPYEPIDLGMPLLCGHVHDSWRIRESKRGSFMFNVGVDAPGNDYKPIAFDEIKDIYYNHVHNKDSST